MARARGGAAGLAGWCVAGWCRCTSTTGATGTRRVYAPERRRDDGAVTGKPEGGTDGASTGTRRRRGGSAIAIRAQMGRLAISRLAELASPQTPKGTSRHPPKATQRRARRSGRWFGLAGDDKEREVRCIKVLWTQCVYYFGRPKGIPSIIRGCGIKTYWISLPFSQSDSQDEELVAWPLAP